MKSVLALAFRDEYYFTEVTDRRHFPFGYKLISAIKWEYVLTFCQLFRNYQSGAPNAQINIKYITRSKSLSTTRFSIGRISQLNGIINSCIKIVIDFTIYFGNAIIVLLFIKDMEL